MWLTAAKVLLDNWKLVLVGLFVAAVVGYIGLLRHEVSSLKEDKAQLELVIAKYKDNETQLKRDAEALTKKYEGLQKEYNKKVDDNAKLVKDKIRLNKELADTRVSLDAIRLFNESKGDSGATATVEGDNGKADSAEKVPLTGVWQIIAENDANHLKCVKALTELQDIWIETNQIINAVRSD